MEMLEPLVLRVLKEQLALKASPVHQALQALKGQQVRLVRLAFKESPALKVFKV
jgi:hypothetical protein